VDSNEGVVHPQVEAHKNEKPCKVGDNNVKIKIEIKIVFGGK